MIKFIKYDLKTNKTYITTIFAIQILIMLGIFLLTRLTSLKIFLANRQITDILFISSIIFFVGINFIFAINYLYKDYFTKRSMLSFSLPISTRTIVLSRILGLSIFYLLTGFFFSISLDLLGYDIGGDFIYYLVFGLSLYNLLALALNLNMARTRFTGKVSWLGMLISLALLIIPAIGLTHFKALILIDGALVSHSGMDLAFIFPFAIGDDGLYKIITPLVYYLLADLVLYLVNVKYIERNLDLS